MEYYDKKNDRDKNHPSPQECADKSVKIRRNDDKSKEFQSDKKGFVHTPRSDTRNMISNKKPGPLVRLNSLAVGAA